MNSKKGKKKSEVRSRRGVLFRSVGGKVLGRIERGTKGASQVIMKSCRKKGVTRKRENGANSLRGVKRGGKCRKVYGSLGMREGHKTSKEGLFKEGGFVISSV